MSRRSGGPGPLARLLRPFLGGPRWPPFWLFRQEVALPGAEPELEAATAEIMGEVQRRKPASGSFQVTTVRLEEGDHLFIMPLRGPSGFGTLLSDWSRLGAEVGPGRWGELAARGNRSMETFSVRIFMEHPGLGWRPEGAPGLGNRSGAFLFDLFHLRPAAEAEFLPVVRELAGVCRDSRLPGGFSVLACMAGAEMPLLCLVWSAADAAELRRQEETLATGGGGPVLARLEAMARRRERMRGELRPALSHLP